MTGLINLISEYSSRLAILPILAIMNVIISIIIHFINSKKILKYIPSLFIGIVALVIGIYSLTIFTTPRGLNTAWIAVFLATTALIGICVCFIIDLISSLRRDLGKDKLSYKSDYKVNKNSKFVAKRRRNKDYKND